MSGEMTPTEHTADHDVDLLDEYDFSGGVWGKYVDCYAVGTNVVALAPNFAAAFPDSKAVNEALRTLLRIAHLARKNGSAG